MYSKKKPNTVPLEGKQNGMVLRGDGIGVLRYTEIKLGKVWWQGILGDMVFGAFTVVRAHHLVHPISINPSLIKLLIYSVQPEIRFRPIRPLFKILF